MAEDRNLNLNPDNHKLSQNFRGKIDEKSDQMDICTNLFKKKIPLSNQMRWTEFLTCEKEIKHKAKKSEKNLTSFSLEPFMTGQKLFSYNFRFLYDNTRL